ncbi:rhamnan synthesis F family protein [uncultured Nitratireductor sp.]|uniref:rhamnan synthesis F family protein n=1 Tax=uncultured Nitratireductor sp. TaxID=520953 RepID=UPI00262DF3D5|nr:rhamnan synthesis F family protein [uncultured Nitratireductor sp.]
MDWDDEQERNLVRELLNTPHRDAGTLVSVVMPTKDRSHCIENAIQSVLCQTHTNFELIIVDDGSIDETEDVVKKFQDNRIHYITNFRSQGVSGARNAGLAQCRGRWVFFLDTDNRWRPNMIEFMLKHARREQISAGYCGADLLMDGGDRRAVLYSDFDFESLARENFIDLNCFFLRWDGPYKQLQFREDLRRLVDWDFILRVAAHTRVKGLPYIGVDYYDGSRSRITNSESVESDKMHALMADIRNDAIRYIAKAETWADAASYRVAVVFHVYHPDIVDECLDRIRRINFQFDLFITTPLDEKHECLVKIKTAFPQATIFHFPNVGADLAPFLELVSTLKNHYVVAKIHTKRDVGAYGGVWRMALLDGVLGSPTLIDEAIARFQADPDLAMICSQDFYKEGFKNSIPATAERLREIAARMNLSKYLERNWAFVAGTMFWIRPALLLDLARHMCDSPGYSQDYISDGAIEHALERAVGVALWDSPRAKVGLEECGKIKIFPLGEGHITEGVSETMKRLSAA